METVSHSTSCAHCGEQCGSPVQASGRLFCCDGCKAVYELLLANNMCTYYDLDEAAGVKVDVGETLAEFDLLDDERYRAIVVDFEQGPIVHARFTIPAMHCASCVWLLEQLHRLQPGIIASSVDILRKTVRIEFRSTEVSLKHIATLLTRLGYRPLIREEGSSSDIQLARRKLVSRLGVAGFAMGNTMLFGAARYLAGDTPLPDGLSTVFATVSVILAIPVLIYSASPWWRSAWGAIRHRTVNLDVPVAIGIAVLFGRSITDVALGTGDGFLDAFTGLVFFLLVGRLFQQQAFDAVSFDRTWKSFFPLTVRRERKGALETVPVDHVTVGDTLLVRNGEVVPCDCLVDDATAYIDYSFVTGEALPSEATKGGRVHAGGKVLGRTARLTALRDVSHSYLASLWERNSVRVPRSTLLEASNRFGKLFTISAVGLAVVAALVRLPDTALALTVLTSVLIIACPCALTLAAPVALGTAMARLGRKGIFLKNIGVLLELAGTSTVMFDKTGTLTTVQASSHALQKFSDEQRAAIAAVTAQSAHPSSRALRATVWHGPLPEVTSLREIPGVGVEGVADGHTIRVGSADWLGKPGQDKGTMVMVDELDAVPVSMASVLRSVSARTIQETRKRAEVRLLSGDSDQSADAMSGLFAASEMAFQCTPNDKVDAIVEARRSGRAVCMVGDGLNDAAAMQSADVAIAVSDETSTLVPACDVIIRGSAIAAVPSLLRLGRTMKTLIWVNLWVSMVYNAVGLTVAVMGIMSPVFVAILMPVSSLTVIGISVAGARLAIRRLEWQ